MWLIDGVGHSGRSEVPNYIRWREPRDRCTGTTNGVVIHKCLTRYFALKLSSYAGDICTPMNNTPMNNTPIRKDQTHDNPTFKSSTQHAPIRNARTRNAPKGQTVIAQGNALGMNVPPKPRSPIGADVRVNHVAPSGQACIKHTQGVALGYRRLCRWHIGQNEVTPIAMIQYTKIQSNTWQSNANQPLDNAHRTTN